MKLHSTRPSFNALCVFDRRWLYGEFQRPSENTADLPLLTHYFLPLWPTKEDLGGYFSCASMLCLPCHRFCPVLETQAKYTVFVLHCPSPFKIDRLFNFNLTIKKKSSILLFSDLLMKMARSQVPRMVVVTYSSLYAHT